MSKLKIIICFIVGAIVGIIIAVVLICKEINNRPQLYGVMSIKNYEGGDYSPKHYYTNKTVSQIPHGIINSPTLAAQIGSAVLTDVYGEEEINMEYPFYAVEYQTLWEVLGTPPCNYGGIDIIEIYRNDGMIVGYMHEK